MVFLYNVTILIPVHCIFYLHAATELVLLQLHRAASQRIPLFTINSEAPMQTPTETAQKSRAMAHTAVSQGRGGDPWSLRGRASGRTWPRIMP